MSFGVLSLSLRHGNAVSYLAAPHKPVMFARKRDVPWRNIPQSRSEDISSVRKYFTWVRDLAGIHFRVSSDGRPRPAKPRERVASAEQDVAIVNFTARFKVPDQGDLEWSSPESRGPRALPTIGRGRLMSIKNRAVECPWLCETSLRQISQFTEHLVEERCGSPVSESECIFNTQATSANIEGSLNTRLKHLCYVRTRAHGGRGTEKFT